jgi:hypothetical protein
MDYFCLRLNNAAVSPTMDYFCLGLNNAAVAAAMDCFCLRLNDAAGAAAGANFVCVSKLQQGQQQQRNGSGPEKYLPVVAGFVGSCVEKEKLFARQATLIN